VSQGCENMQWREVVWQTVFLHPGLPPDRVAAGLARGTVREAKPTAVIAQVLHTPHLARGAPREHLPAGIEGEGCALADSQGEFVPHAIRAILTDLGLIPDQEGRLAEFVSRHLRAFVGGTA